MMIISLRLGTIRILFIDVEVVGCNPWFYRCSHRGILFIAILLIRTVPSRLLQCNIVEQDQRGYLTGILPEAAYVIT